MEPSPKGSPATMTLPYTARMALIALGLTFIGYGMLGELFWAPMSWLTLLEPFKFFLLLGLLVLLPATGVRVTLAILLVLAVFILGMGLFTDDWIEWMHVGEFR